jgi:hypothetical protein
VRSSVFFEAAPVVGGEWWTDEEEGRRAKLGLNNLVRQTDSTDSSERPTTFECDLFPHHLHLFVLPSPFAGGYVYGAGMAREQHAFACCHLVIASSATDFAFPGVPVADICCIRPRLTTKSPRKPITAGEYGCAGHAHLLT